MVKPNHAAENVLATIGAVCWTVQILPQIWKSYREKSTHGLSVGLVGIWGVSAIPLGTYIVAQHLSIPLQIQPHAFGVLSTVSVAQCLYYSHGWSLKKTVASMVAFCVFWAGFETGSIYAVWKGQDNGTDAPLLLYGYLSAVLLAVALLPQYWEIYKLKEVKGISMTFMAIDIAGGLFSVLSLIFRDDFDVAAAVSYSLVVVLDSIVVILAFVLNPIAKKRRRTEEGQVGSADAPGNTNDFVTSETLQSDVTRVEEDEEKNARVMPMPDLSVEIPEEQRRREHARREAGDVV